MDNPRKEFMILTLMFVFMIMAILAFIYGQPHGFAFVVFIIILFVHSELVGVLMNSFFVKRHKEKMNKYIAWRLYEIGVDGWGDTMNDIYKPRFEKPTDLPESIVSGVERVIKKEQAERRANWESLRDAGQKLSDAIEKEFSSTEKTHR